MQYKENFITEASINIGILRVKKEQEDGRNIKSKPAIIILHPVFVLGSLKEDTSDHEIRKILIQLLYKNNMIVKVQKIMLCNNKLVNF
jgi:hypothetical protein